MTSKKANRAASTIQNRAIWSKSRIVGSYGRQWGFLDPGERAVLSFVADDIRGKPLLDLGVGGGRTVPLLHLLSADYLGVDYTPEMVQQCRALYPERQFLNLDARDLSTLAAHHFALAFFSFNGIDAVGHDDRLKVFHEVRRVLAPGGYFVFNSHNYGGPDMVLRPWHVREIFSTRHSRGVREAVRQVLGLRRSIANYRRVATLSVDDGCHALAPNPGHGYSLLMYYGSPDETLSDLARAGFDAVEVFTGAGERVSADSDVRHAAWLYYVARVPAAGV